jgi:hypothetical protein
VIPRPRDASTVRHLLRRYPVVGIIGARQVGKSTLARAVAKAQAVLGAYFDLEDPRDLARLADPIAALETFKGLVVLDEVQRFPGLFEVLRVLADRPGQRRRFLVLGSASPALLRQGSESLAGRIAYHELGGFTLEEVGPARHARLWLRGGFPRAFTARSDAQSDAWRSEFVRTFLERDIPALGIGVQPATLRRFWTMLAHYHGQVWNASEFGRAFGVADTTARNYLDLLTAAMVVKQLQPWHENIGKRQVKAPKVYLADSGLLHTLLNLPTLHDLQGHPKVGASWEGFALEQVVRHLGARGQECYFWATHGGAELDLLVIRGSRRLGFEFKRTTAPKQTPSMRSALHDLGLRSLTVVHAGAQTFSLGDGIRAVALGRILQDIEPLR